MTVIYIIMATDNTGSISDIDCFTAMRHVLSVNFILKQEILIAY